MQKLRIIYGLSGYGFGHANRAISIGESLMKDYEILFITGGEAIAFMKEHFSQDCFLECPSFRNQYSRHGMSAAKTLMHGIFHAPRAFQYIKKIYPIILKWNPDFFITDFEPYAYQLAKRLRKPIINFTDQTFMSYCNIKDYFDFKNYWALKAASLVSKIFCPKASRTFITKPFPLKIAKKDKNIHLINPVLRKDIVVASVKNKMKENHILVYLHDKTRNILDVVARYAEENGLLIKAYCHWPVPSVKNKIIVCQFNRNNFIEDMLQSQLVVATAGNELISEIAYLGIPAVIVPQPGAIEQYANAKLADLFFSNCKMLKTKDFCLYSLKKSIEILKETKSQISLGGKEQLLNFIADFSKTLVGAKE